MTKLEDECREMIKKELRLIEGIANPYENGDLTVEQVAENIYQIVRQKQIEAWEERGNAEPSKCEVCDSTGINHSDDDNPCGVCNGYGMIFINPYLKEEYVTKL